MESVREGRENNMLKNFPPFLLCCKITSFWRTKSPPFLGQPSALLAFSLVSVSNQCLEKGGGEVLSFQETGKGCVASLSCSANPCGSSLFWSVFLCNESLIPLSASPLSCWEE